MNKVLCGRISRNTKSVYQYDEHKKKIKFLVGVKYVFIIGPLCF